MTDVPERAPEAVTSEPVTSSTWPDLTSALIAGTDLTAAQAGWAMSEVMEGRAEPIALAGFLVALEAKGETVAEVAGFAASMVEHAVPMTQAPEAVDIVGTGGDRAQTVNISTMASIVTAGAGYPVVKHGNRAASSRSGSADVLEALGIRLDLPVESVREVYRRADITFCFAPVFHPSMRYAAPARSGLRIATIFNVLGPITNPARPGASAVGSADVRMAPIIAGVFAERGTSALVFRGQDGLDELSVAAPSDVWEVRDGEVVRLVLDPERLLGIPRSPIDALRGGSAADNAKVALDLFGGARGPVRDAVLLNAAAGVTAARAARGLDTDAAFDDRFRTAYDEAAASLDSGAATARLDAWKAATTS